MKHLIIIVLLVTSFQSISQSIVSWTEENSTLGLGFPVPVPVETAEPFDGFRTYNGLFIKHQSMALNNNYITGHIVGQTVYDRDIWAYVLSDENNLTQYGIKEGAMLINGSIHAREWQSPEVMTGIIELLDANSQDNSLHQYLLENTTIVSLPINNVDGLLQTQRYPAENWFSSQIGPRDGRMRRKNMLNVDEDLFSQTDFLLGVDLNRNNDPYWATSNNSSPIVTSIVYHGSVSESEPETRARLAAADLVEASQVRVYTDVHSFTKVHFSVRTNNINRNTLQTNLLRDFTNHHRAFPAEKNYMDSPSGSGGGIGSTDEYFAETYQVPSWTLEVEPGNGGGTEYGGFGNNGHDGFILPDSEIKRVREQLAETFMVVWYGQAGPPSIAQLRVVEKDSQNIVYDASWDVQADGTRLLFENDIENMLEGVDYSLIVTFDKPMRVRDENNQVVHLQGQNSFELNPLIEFAANGVTTSLNNDGQWINQKAENVMSYKFYKDDTYAVDFGLGSEVFANGSSSIVWSIDVADMVGQKLDANPQTVVTWAGGQWQNYEDSNLDSSIVGGVDSGYTVSIDSQSKSAFPPLIQPTGLYFDPARNGEGFSYELLDGNRVWIQWFTYDELGAQRWYSALGGFSGNTIVVDNFTSASGGVFGAAFDSENIEFNAFGSLEIIFNGGEALEPAIGVHEVSRTASVVFTDLDGKKLRTKLHQLSHVKGAINTPITITLAINEPVGLITGSWYDPQRSGEGYIVEILEDGRAILIWYTYDLEGNHMWLIDSTGVITEDGNNITLDFNNVIVTSGGVFGEDFNSDSVIRNPWGQIQMQLNCLGSGTVEYTSSIEGFESGQYNVVKLTSPWLLPYVCDG